MGSLKIKQHDNNFVVLSLEEAAKLLNLSKRSLSEKANRGEIISTKLGKSRTFLKDDLITFYKNRRTNKKGDKNGK